ncbi:MAG: hypothetical protein ACK4K9_06740 [Bacteroidia bacterium]
MKYNFYNVSGLSFTPREINETIFTILFFTSAIGSIDLNPLYIWVAYLIIDKLGERIIKVNWTRPIGKNPLRSEEERLN